MHGRKQECLGISVAIQLKPTCLGVSGGQTEGVGACLEVGAPKTGCEEKECYRPDTYLTGC